MTYQSSMRVESGLRLVEPLGRDDDQIGLAAQFLFHLRERVGRDPGEGQVFVDAVIDQLVFAQRAGDQRGRRIENEVDGPRESQQTHLAYDLPAKEMPVEFARAPPSVGRYRQRVEREDISFALRDRLEGRRQFPERAR